MNKSNLWRALLIVPLFGVTVLLGGCNSGTSDPPPSAAPSAAPAKVHVHIKMGRPGTDYEQIKIVNAADDKTMIERETVYRDKRVVNEYFAPDGKSLVKRSTVWFDKHTLVETFYSQGPAAGNVKESTETFPGGANTKLHTLYDEQGQVASQEEYRNDKTLSVGKKRQADGTMETRRYQKDGVALSSLELVRPDQTVETSSYKADGKTLVTFEVARSDGSKETSTYRADGIRLFSVEKLSSDRTKDATYYRYDGKTVWAKIKSKGYYDVREIESYKPDGTLDFRRVMVNDDTMEVTVYGGTPGNPVALFKQVWKNNSSYYWSKSFDVASVEQYRSDGKTVEKLYEYYNRSSTLKQFTSFNTDGSKSVKYFRSSNGTLEKEETYDTAGTLTKTDPVDEAKGIREQVDYKLVKQPDFDDPTAWRVPKD